MLVSMITVVPVPEILFSISSRPRSSSKLKPTEATSSGSLDGSKPVIMGSPALFTISYSFRRQGSHTALRLQQPLHQGSPPYISICYPLSFSDG